MSHATPQAPPALRRLSRTPRHRPRRATARAGPPGYRPRTPGRRPRRATAHAAAYARRAARRRPRTPGRRAAAGLTPPQAKGAGPNRPRYSAGAAKLLG